MRTNRTHKRTSRPLCMRAVGLVHSLSFARSFRRVVLPLSLVAGLASIANGQGSASPSPTCRASLDSLVAKVRTNYAGHLLEVVGTRHADHSAMLRRLAERADTTRLADCYALLSAYTGWYADRHLFVFQSQTTDAATAGRRALALRRLGVTETSAREALTRRGTRRDPIEGIWYDGDLRIAVVPDPSGPEGTFAGVVVVSDTAAWPVGSVRATFRRIADDEYQTVLLTRSFAEMHLTARIHRGILLRLSPGLWGRAFPLSPVDSSFIDPHDAHRPTVSVRSRSVVFSLPSHDPQYVRLLDSLVAAHDVHIRSRPLLIVDLRGNEGGASFTSRALHPYVASTDRVPTAFDTGTAVMLSSPSQIAYARRFTGTDTSAFVRSLVARMEARPGQLVPLEEAPIAAPPRDEHIEGNWRVVVLIDRGTVSAAEVLVLRALRSTRAVVVGLPTAGALDYQSVNIVSLGTGDRRWALGYPTITAHADLPRRGMRGRGIQPQVRIDWREAVDALLEIERRFLP